jgi:hypothetical protein
MNMGTLTFQGSSSVSTPSEDTTAKTDSTKIKPTEQPTTTTTTTSKNQSGVVGIKGPVKKIGFSLSVSGTYENLKKLLDIFEKQAYLISIKSVNFTDIKGSQFTFNITGDIYSY